MKKKIILASTSPRRKELLRKTGLVFDVVGSDYEEDMSLEIPALSLAEHLARGKAEAVAKRFSDALIISADTFISYEGKIVGKPHTKERAKEMLCEFSGKTHSVITGFCVIDSDKIVTRSVETKVIFRTLDEKEIDEYIATGEPLDKAGAYAIQGYGGKLIEKIEGDYSNVVGLPIEELLRTLRSDFGLDF